MYRPFHARNDLKQESRKKDAKNQNAGASSRHYYHPNADAVTSGCPHVDLYAKSAQTWMLMRL
jgi:uncharacterized heparinase superfamily protein